VIGWLKKTDILKKTKDLGLKRTACHSVMTGHLLEMTELLVEVTGHLLEMTELNIEKIGWVEMTGRCQENGPEMTGNFILDSYTFPVSTCKLLIGPVKLLNYIIVHYISCIYIYSATTTTTVYTIYYCYTANTTATASATATVTTTASATANLSSTSATASSRSTSSTSSSSSTSISRHDLVPRLLYRLLCCSPSHVVLVDIDKLAVKLAATPEWTNRQTECPAGRSTISLDLRLISEKL